VIGNSTVEKDFSTATNLTYSPTGTTTDQLKMADVRQFVYEKLKRTSSESYDMLVTVLKLGMQKVSVTDGQIHSKLTFNVRASDFESTASSSIDAKSSSWNIGGKLGIRAKKWNMSVAGGYSSSKVTVKVVNERSSSAVNLNADIVGSVTINFKTESFPAFDAE